MKRIFLRRKHIKETYFKSTILVMSSASNESAFAQTKLAFWKISWDIQIAAPVALVINVILILQRVSSLIH